MLSRSLAAEPGAEHVLDALPGFVWTAFSAGKFDYLCEPWVEYTGLGVEESCGSGWQAAVHPDDLQPLLAAWRPDAAVNGVVETEVRLRRSDGTYRRFLFHAQPSFDASLQVLRWCGFITDIDQRLRAVTRDESLLIAENQLLEMILNGRPLLDVLEAVCRQVERAAPGSYCFIALVDPSCTKLEDGIGPSLPSQLTDFARGWPLHRNGGPCVMASRDNARVMVADATSDTRWGSGWRALVEASGLRSCWSTPVVSQTGKVVGTVALYQREPGLPSPLHLTVMERFTRLAGVAIQRARRDAELQRSEGRLAEMERELQLTIDTMPVLVATYRVDGTRTFVNQTWLDYTGLSLSSVMDAEDASTIHPDDARRVFREWQKSRATGGAFKAEVRLRRADGQFRWHLVHRLLARDESGAIVRWYSVGIDIEDRKRAEEALRESERALRSAIDTIPGFVIILDPDGAVEVVNRQVLEYLGQSTAELRSSGTNGSIHPDDLPRVLDVFAASIASGAPYHVEHRLRRFDGEYRWFDNRGIPIRDDFGRVHRSYVLLTDIHERKNAEAALNAARATLARTSRVITLGALTASIAHEVNQPLSGIITNAGTCLRMLGDNPPNVDGARVTAQRTLRDGARAAEIIQHLRAMYTHRERTAERVDINEATREVLALSLSELERSGVTLLTEIDESLPPIIGDRVQLQQVILNLVLNGVDAMRSINEQSRTLLIVTVNEDGKRIRVSVRDCGVGIRAEDRDKIFDAFFTTKSSGMGIGLSISRSIIESHAGQLWATNNDGPGATFSFSVPAAPASA